METDHKGPYNELLVLVHPNWLNYATEFGLQKHRTIELTKNLYSKGHQEAIDWERYRKAMFAIYGRAIIEAAKNPKAMVAIFAVPMGLRNYKAIIEKDKTLLKNSEFNDAMRLIGFAKKILGRRLIVINSPGLNELKQDCERLVSIIARKKVALSRDFVLRAGGEISTGCVQTVINNLRLLLNPKMAFVDKKICGDLLIKEKLVRRRLERRAQRNKKIKTPYAKPRYKK
ncbi:MAG: hypothetical protein N3F05_01690 [Candidatus Diapherotrites archaeon]|nr:hypothetical protein [Candidatus Diapherotrites archaeon]